MTSVAFLILQTELGFTLLYYTLAFLFAASIFICIYTFRELIRETRLPGKRLFGFNCDDCTGKYRANGKPYFRCYLKKPILTWLLKSKLLKPLTANN